MCLEAHQLSGAHGHTPVVEGHNGSYNDALETAPA
jgi:hypothetical protein